MSSQEVSYLFLHWKCSNRFQSVRSIYIVYYSYIYIINSVRYNKISALNRRLLSWTVRLKNNRHIRFLMPTHIDIFQSLGFYYNILFPLHSLSHQSLLGICDTSIWKLRICNLPILISSPLSHALTSISLPLSSFISIFHLHLQTDFRLAFFTFSSSSSTFIHTFVYVN